MICLAGLVHGSSLLVDGAWSPHPAKVLRRAVHLYFSRRAAVSTALRAVVTVATEANDEPSREPQWLDRLLARYPGACEWTPGVLYGAFLGDLPIVFDRGKGGLLCTPIIDDPNVWCRHFDERPPRDVVHVYAGVQTRLGTGDPLPYAVARVLRERFVPYLDVQDDYDRDNFDEIFDGLGWSGRIQNAPLRELPALTVSGIEPAARAYRGLTDLGRWLRTPDAIPPRLELGDVCRRFPDVPMRLAQIALDGSRSLVRSHGSRWTRRP